MGKMVRTVREIAFFRGTSRLVKYYKLIYLARYGSCGCSSAKVFVNIIGRQLERDTILSQ